MTGIKFNIYSNLYNIFIHNLSISSIYVKNLRNRGSTVNFLFHHLPQGGAGIEWATTTSFQIFSNT
jgi:hypothetical protein